MPDPNPSTPRPSSPLSNVHVVLHEPQDPVNIGAVVRAMKNMGLLHLRLVRPADFDPTLVELVAHDTRDLVEGISRFDTLDDAIADCAMVAAFTARRRAAKRRISTPRTIAGELLEQAELGPVALLFGREDRGLSNDELDRANVVVTVPTSEHSSLNLAQAVLIGLYELHLAAPASSRRLAPPRKDAPPATSAHYETLFADVERALAELDFFQTRNPELIMRTVRSLAFRAAPDAREIALMRAMALEVVHALDRARARP